MIAKVVAPRPLPRPFVIGHELCRGRRSDLAAASRRAASERLRAQDRKDVVAKDLDQPEYRNTVAARHSAVERNLCANAQPAVIAQICDTWRLPKVALARLSTLFGQDVRQSRGELALSEQLSYDVVSASSWIRIFA